MMMHLITLCLVVATLAAFLTLDGTRIAFMPRAAAFALLVLLLLAGAAIVIKDGSWPDTVRAAAVVGLVVLFLSYPQIQARRGKPVKNSVLLSLGVCLVFGAYLYLSEMPTAKPVTPAVPTLSH